MIEKDIDYYKYMTYSDCEKSLMDYGYDVKNICGYHKDCFSNSNIYYITYKMIGEYPITIVMGYFNGSFNIFGYQIIDFYAKDGIYSKYTPRYAY